MFLIKKNKRYSPSCQTRKGMIGFLGTVFIILFVAYESENSSYLLH